MIIYLSCSLLSLLIYYIFNKKNVYANKSKFVQYILFVIPGMILILLPMFRENVGVDYDGYIILYNRIINGHSTNTEIGFNILVKIVDNFYHEPKAMFALFSLLTIPIFLITIYKTSKNSIFSVFLFISMGYYFLTFNAIRYYFALSIVFYSYNFLIKKNKFKFILCILFASLFHKTALIMIPIGFLVIYKTKYDYVLLMGFALCCLLFKNPIRTIAFHLYPTYLGTVYDGGSSSLFNVLKGIYIIILGYMFKNKISEDTELSVLYKINILALIIYVCCDWLPELSRIGFYLNITSIIFIPNLISQLNNKNNKFIISILTIVLFSIYIMLMLNQGYSSTIKLLPYQTWLF